MVNSKRILLNVRFYVVVVVVVICFFCFFFLCVKTFSHESLIFKRTHVSL